jgi:hypothetical protein
LCSEDKKLCSEASDILEDDDHTMEMFFMAPEFIEERLDKELCSYCEGQKIPADAEDDHMMEMIDNHTMEMFFMALNLLKRDWTRSYVATVKDQKFLQMQKTTT